MATAQDIINIEKAEMGTKENPYNSNITKYGEWYGINGQPWCAIFQSWCFKDSGLFKKFASCTTWMNWCKQNGCYYSTPKIGDLVFFNFDKNPDKNIAKHMGLVIDIGDDYILTIEGNTSLSSNGSQDNGGIVAQKKRKLSSVVGFGRPNYENSSIDKFIYGVDLSSNQGDIDFSKLSKFAKFAILRCTVKGNTIDKKFEEYYQSCINNGIKVMVYKYSYAKNTTEAIAEANSVLKILKGRKTKVWLDLEWNTQAELGKTEIANITNAFCNTIKNGGCDVGLYFNMNWYRNFIDKTLLSKYDYWIARYGQNDGTLNINYIPNVGEKIWQYTSIGKIDGIKGNVDLDVMYNDIDLNSIVTPTVIINNNTLSVKNIVTASSLNIRKSNSISSQIVGSFKKGTEIQIDGYVKGWYKVKNGWVSENYVKTNTAKVTASKLNVRAGNNTSYKSMALINKNTIVRLLKYSQGWYLITTGEITGWVYEKYLI